MEMPDRNIPLMLKFRDKDIFKCCFLGFVKTILKPLKKTLNCLRGKFVIGELVIPKGESKERSPGFYEIIPDDSAESLLRPPQRPLQGIFHRPKARPPGITLFDRGPNIVTGIS